MEVNGVSASLSEYYAELAKLRARNAPKGSPAELFGKADANGNESVDAGEFAALFSQAQTAAAATAENGTGNAGTGDSPPPFTKMSAEEIESLFAEADGDGDGALSLEEFTALRDKVLPPPPGDRERQGVDNDSVGEAGDFSSLLFQVSAKETEDLESLFAGADTDGDGVLSIEEFTALRDKLRPPAPDTENQQGTAGTIQDFLSLLYNSSGQAGLFETRGESGTQGESSSSETVFAELLKNFGTLDDDSKSTIASYIQELIQKAYSA
jgi:Ca2+-binding EF-hand superfamily protein